MNKKILLILLFILTASAYLFSDDKNESEKINIALLPVINSSGHREINKASEKTQVCIRTDPPPSGKIQCNKRRKQH